MKYQIEGTRLILTVSPEEQAELQSYRDENPDEFGTYHHECEVMEPLLCNSELDWVNPCDTGDITDAPMVGIIGEEVIESRLPADRYGAVQVGFWDGHARWSPILKRWAFMSYEVRSFLTDLADNGRAVFVSE